MPEETIEEQPRSGNTDYGRIALDAVNRLEVKVTKLEELFEKEIKGEIRRGNARFTKVVASVTSVAMALIGAMTQYQVSSARTQTSQDVVQATRQESQLTEKALERIIQESTKRALDDRLHAEKLAEKLAKEQKEKLEND